MFRRRKRWGEAVEREGDAIADALRGGMLEGRAVVPLEIAGSDGVVFAVEIGEDEIRDAWEHARTLVATLERWPLVVATWGEKPEKADLFSRFYYGEAKPSPTTVATTAREMELDDALDIYRAWRGDPRDEEADEESGDHLDWFVPKNDTVLVTFLPTTRSEESLAYMGFYGADLEHGHEALIAILRVWGERYGAEVVAHWGTMLQLVVANPPQELGDARVLAEQQSLVAPDTLRLPGVSLDAHARALVGRGDWFLHERP